MRGVKDSYCILNLGAPRITKVQISRIRVEGGRGDGELGKDGSKQRVVISSYN